MRVFFIVDEFPFFLPEYLDKTIESLKKAHITIVGITPLITSRGKKTLYSYLMREIARLGITSIVKLSVAYCQLVLGQVVYACKLSFTPHTITQVAHKYNIPIFSTSSVNAPEYLEKLEYLDVEVLVSSCSQIFKKDILSLPTVACINRHSGLLPSYGGLFPVFQAMIHDEKYVGATVHTMVEKIDGGTILSQKKYKIKKSDTLFSLYIKTYEMSVSVTVQAILALTANRKMAVVTRYKESYFSFPKPEDWDEFWRKGKVVI